MFGELTKKAVSSVLSIALVFQSTIGNVYAANPNTAARVDWKLAETNTSVSGVPSNLKYFQYYDVLPDDITTPIYKNMNLSTVAGKKLFVGYGTIDPDGTMCRYFPELGRSECLPWWRIEREYAVPDTNSTPATDFLKNLTMLYPPKNIQYCKEWKINEQLDGGKVTCTSYYDKRKSVDCLANPEQSACYVDQCSNGVKTACTLVGKEAGDTSTLQRPMVGNAGVPVGLDMITGLKTHQYNCPAGYMPGKECNDWIYGVTYPYECKAPTSVAANDGEYVYCDTNPLPYYDNTGTLTGFTSNDKCSDGSVMDGATGTNGKQRMCPVNSYSQTQKVCTDPIIKVESNIDSQTINQKRTFKDYETSVLFGDEVGDIYAGDPLCLRLNTVEGARQANLNVHIVGNGHLDDDIYVLRHKTTGGFNKVYCNMQHNGGTSGRLWSYTFPGYATTGVKNVTIKLLSGNTISRSISVVNSGATPTTTDIPDQVNKGAVVPITFLTSIDNGGLSINFGDGSGYHPITVYQDSNSGGNVYKTYNGESLECIANNGTYAFDQNVTISSSDIISVQQATEDESSGATPFNETGNEHTGNSSDNRSHYGSSAVTIDNVLAAPATWSGIFPNYPAYDWGQGSGNLLRIWENTAGTISLMFPYAGAYQLFFYSKSNALVASAEITTDDFRSMSDTGNIQLKLGQSMALSPNMVDGNTTDACRNDDFVEWGGGVYGGKGSISGTPCAGPNDSYVPSKAVYNVIVKDLLTGTITPIPLVYPLPYPNRVFISKLKILENRKYRCYDPFPVVSAGAGCIIGVQNESNPISDYRGASVNMMRASTLYCDVTSEKVVGCNNEKTVQNDGGITYPNSDQYETIDNSGMFMNALAGAQLSEQMMHIWSGWPGECEHGVFTDFSWASDPKTLASLAMSAYSSMNAASAAAGSTSDAAATAGNAAPDPSVVASGATAAEQAATLIDQGATMADLAQMSGNIGAFAQAAEKASYWADSLGNTLKVMVDGATSSVTAEFTKIATDATSAVSDMMGATGGGSTYLDDLVKNYNDAVTYTKTIYNEIVNPAQVIADKTSTIEALGQALQVSTDPDTIASINAEISNLTADITKINASLSGQILQGVNTTSTYLSSLFTDPATADAAKSAAANMGVVGATQGQMADIKSFFDRMNEYNAIGDIGFQTINWTDIATAGYRMYANVAANKDEMTKAWEAQKAYVLSGEGTSNDIASNAYASCMASVGANFVNTISIASGAKDSNTTSQELLTPWHNPMRISLQSLYELRSIVGDAFMEVSYKAMDIDYNMQMITIVALNGAAYGQLTQLVCGGYNVATLANAVNQNAAKKPSLVDGLMKMTPQQAAMMAASMACSLAGPWAFACSLALKLFSSFSSGDACTDEKIAQSQKPIQLKTNKFQKFGQCHHTGGSCSKKMLGSCSLHKETYCCYDQIMTRIFAEGVKAQRGTGWNSCNDITINDLKYISFTPCTPTQDPYTDKCFPIESYRELNNELKKQIKKGFAVDGDTFMSQMQNAMEVVQ